MSHQLLLLSAFLLVAEGSWADPQNYPFKLLMQAVDGKHVVMAKNAGPAPILARVVLKDPENAVIDRQSPIELLIKPDDSLPVARISPAEKGMRYRVATSYKFSIGDPDAKHDPVATYRLPFRDGQAVKIGQMPGGRITTHKDPDSKYAIDFSVPNGTPVVAARKGRVVDVDRDFTKGGNDPALKANHVLLLHEDGTLGLYSHFAPQRIVVQVGDNVETGALLGNSGNTGYSSGPHLHFAVLINTRTPDGTANYVSVPLEFVDEAPPRKLQLRQDETLVTHHEQH